MLAMDSSAPRLSSSHALSLTTIAGKPAPTKDRVRVENEVTSELVKAPKKASDGLQYHLEYPNGWNTKNLCAAQ